MAIDEHDFIRNVRHNCTVGDWVLLPLTGQLCKIVSTRLDDTQNLWYYTLEDKDGNSVGSLPSFDCLTASRC